MEKVKFKTCIFVKNHSIMNAVELKSELIHLIETVEDINILHAIKLLLVKITSAEINQEGESWSWDDLPDALKTEIEEGLEQAERGEFIEHEQVREKYIKWL